MISASQPDARSTLVAITRWGLHIPGFDLKTIIPGYDGAPACAAEQAHEVLGRKGLLFKEPATILALCAIHRALGLPFGCARSKDHPDPETAVVVSSNLGNVATVHKIVRQLQSGTVHDVSALDAPNASSNIIASTIAIWFRFGGPNLMVCSGANSGVDAIRLGCTLLRAGRAGRVFVVGVEPDDQVASLIFDGTSRAKSGAAGKLRASAACIVLEQARPATSASIVLLPGGSPSSRSQTPLTPDLLIGAAHMAGSSDRILDLAACLGDTYGAQAILQTAIAAEILQQKMPEGWSAVQVLSDHPLEGWRSLMVTSFKN